MKEVKMINALQVVMDSWMNLTALFLNNTYKYIRSVFF